jgi:hypothetical protein
MRIRGTRWPKKCPCSVPAAFSGTWKRLVRRPGRRHGLDAERNRLADVLLPSGLIWLIGFVVCNAVGIGLWRRRARIAPFTAVVILLATILVVGLLELSTIDLLRSPAWGPMLMSHGREGWLRRVNPQSLWQGRLFLLIGIPALLVYVRLMDQAAQGVRKSFLPSVDHIDERPGS